jgi:hypothetical protein
LTTSLHTCILDDGTPVDCDCLRGDTHPIDLYAVLLGDEPVDDEYERAE